jgi:hypothetical protein
MLEHLFEVDLGRDADLYWLHDHMDFVRNRCIRLPRRICGRARRKRKNEPRAVCGTLLVRGHSELHLDPNEHEEKLGLHSLHLDAGRHHERDHLLEVHQVFQHAKWVQHASPGYLYLPSNSRRPEPSLRLASSNTESKRVDSRTALLKVDCGDYPAPR